MTFRARLVLAVVVALLILQPLVVLGERGVGALLDGTLESVLTGAQVGTLFANSIFLALLTTLFACLLALPAIWVLGLFSVRGEGFFTALLAVPLIIPPHIHTIAWTRVLGDKGWLSVWLSEQGLDVNVRLPLASGEGLLAHIYPGPAWVMAAAFFPLVALPVIMTLRRMDRDGWDALRLFMPGRRALVARALAEAAPAFAAGLVAVFALSLMTYPVVSLLDTPVLVQKVHFVFSQVDQSAGALLALPLVVIGVLAVLILARLEGSLMAGLSGTLRPRERAGGLPMAVLLVALVLGAGLPLGSLLREAGPLALGAGVDNYQSVFARTQEAFRDTGLLLLVAMPVMLILALAGGRLMARGKVGVIDALAALPFALPPVAVGVALLLNVSAMDAGEAAWASVLAGILAGLCAGGSVRERLLIAGSAALAGFLLQEVLGASGLARGLFVEGPVLPVLGWLALYLPLAARLLRFAFLRVDQDAVDAARLMGASSFARFRLAEWPHVRGTLAAVALLTLILCMTELSATLLLLRPGWQFLQVRIFNMVHYQSAGEVAALCVLVLLATLLPLLVVRLAFREKRS